MGRRFGQLRKMDKRLCRSGVAPCLSTGIGTALLVLALYLPVWPAQAPQGQPKRPAQSSSQAAPPPEQDDSGYDWVRAEHDVEVGTFYVHKGDVDAGIARFQDAVRVQPNFAKARRLLGEAWEKKGDRAAALKCYQEYLQLFPHASDAKKIREKIEKLSGTKG
jgi:tetratricopeptide (TPR) repeat protein